MAGTLLRLGFLASLTAVSISSLGEAAQRDAVDGAIAGVNADPADDVLLVATKSSPPFSFRGEDGEWTGISIELWRQLAEELELDYEFREATLAEMLDGVETGTFDAAVAAITVTAERHERVDFCHPHHTTGFGVAVSARHGTDTWVLVRRILSPRLLLIVGLMIAVVLGCGLLFWRFERRDNESMFGGERRRGIGMGVWWSTILLFGHKGIVPVSIGGRLLAAASMIASILLLSTITGVIASVLTVRQLDTGISRITDLKHLRVATIAASTSAEFLDQRRIGHAEYDTVEEAIAAVDEGRADAIVYDEALLKFLAAGPAEGRIEVLPVTFGLQEYAIALRLDSPLRKPLNEELLRFRATDPWNDLVFRFLGD